MVRTANFETNILTAFFNIQLIIYGNIIEGDLKQLYIQV